MIYIELFILFSPFVLLYLSYNNLIRFRMAICLFSFCSGLLALVIFCILVEAAGIIEGGIYPNGVIFLNDTAFGYISSLCAVVLYVFTFDTIDYIFTSRKG